MKNFGSEFNVQRRSILKIGSAIAGGAFIPCSSLFAAQSARNILDLQPADEIGYPRPRTFSDNMSRYQQKWQLASAPEETRLSFVTQDNEHRFAHKDGRLISMSDPLFSGIQLERGVYAKVDLYINGQLFVPPKAYIIHEARYEFVNSMQVTNGQRDKFIAQVETGYDVSETNTLIDVVGMATWGKRGAEGRVHSEISSVTRNSHERRIENFEQEIRAETNEAVVYTLWIRADRYRIVDENLNPIQFQALWLLKENGQNSNESVATCNPTIVEVRTQGKVFDRAVFPLS